MCKSRTLSSLSLSFSLVLSRLMDSLSRTLSEKQAGQASPAFPNQIIFFISFREHLHLYHLPEGLWLMGMLGTES